MAHIFHAGFDDLDSAADLALVGPITYSGTPTLSSTTRYSDGKSLDLGINDIVTIDMETQDGNKIFFCCAINPVTVPSGFTVDIIQFLDSTQATQCFFRMDEFNQLKLMRSTTVLATATLPIGTHSILEVDLEVENAGTCVVRVNGTQEFSFSGDTQNSATNSLQFVRFFIPGQGHNFLIDDVIIENDVGTLNNTAPGEVVCRMIYPTSDTSVQFTRNTGATDFSAIDDVVGAPDDDTTYTESAVLLNKNVHGMGTLTNVGTVKAVKEIVRAKKTDVGARTLRAGIKSGVIEQTFDIGVAASYSNSINYFETSDGVTTQFTQATIDSIELTFQDFL